MPLRRRATIQGLLKLWSFFSCPARGGGGRQGQSIQPRKNRHAGADPDSERGGSTLEHDSYLVVIFQSRYLSLSNVPLLNLAIKFLEMKQKRLTVTVTFAMC